MPIPMTFIFSHPQLTKAAGDSTWRKLVPLSRHVPDRLSFPPRGPSSTLSTHCLEPTAGRSLNSDLPPHRSPIRQIFDWRGRILALDVCHVAASYAQTRVHQAHRKGLWKNAELPDAPYKGNFIELLCVDACTVTGLKMAQRCLQTSGTHSISPNALRVAELQVLTSHSTSIKVPGFDGPQGPH